MYFRDMKKLCMSLMRIKQYLEKFKKQIINKFNGMNIILNIKINHMQPKNLVNFVIRLYKMNNRQFQIKLS